MTINLYHVNLYIHIYIYQSYFMLHIIRYDQIWCSQVCCNVLHKCIKHFVAKMSAPNLFYYLCDTKLYIILIRTRKLGLMYIVYCRRISLEWRLNNRNKNTHFSASFFENNSTFSKNTLHIFMRFFFSKSI